MSTVSDGPGDAICFVRLDQGGTWARRVDQLQQYGVRRLMPLRGIPLVHRVLQDAPEPVLPDRGREYLHRIRTGDVLQLASVVRELVRHAPESELERELLDWALNLLAQEITAVEGRAEEVVRSEILRLAGAGRPDQDGQ
ncbi:MAG: hypothetical protein ABMA64_02000 [Myxococcota bacterium]